MKRSGFVPLSSSILSSETDILEEYQRNKCMVPLLPVSINTPLQNDQIQNAIQPSSGSKFSFSSLQPPSMSQKKSRSSTEELERLLLQPLNRETELAKLDFWELDNLLFQANTGQGLTPHAEETIEQLDALTDNFPEPRADESINIMLGRHHDPFFGSTNNSSIGDQPSIDLSWYPETKDLFSPPTPGVSTHMPAHTPQLRKVVPMHELVPRPEQLLTPNSSLRVKGKDLFHLGNFYNSILYS